MNTYQTRHHFRHGHWPRHWHRPWSQAIQLLTLGLKFFTKKWTDKINFSYENII